MKDQTKRTLCNALITAGLIIAGVGIGWTSHSPGSISDSVSVQDTLLVEEVALTFDDTIAMIVPEKLQDVCKAIIWVESRGNDKAYRKSGDCVGLLQIAPIFVKECNRIQSDVIYTLEDRWDPVKSLEMFVIYQNKHNPNHDLHEAIRLHNPTAGPEYKEKVLQKFNTIY